MSPGTCKHFSGIQHDCCAAGLKYSEFPRNQSLPCIKRFATEKRPLAACAKYTEPTTEDLAAEEAETAAYLNLIDKASPIVAEIKKRHRGKDWRGTVTCPGCAGKLHIQHSGYNSHVGCQCETEGCISFQE